MHDDYPDLYGERLAQAAALARIFAPGTAARRCAEGVLQALAERAAAAAISPHTAAYPAAVRLLSEGLLGTLPPSRHVDRALGVCEGTTAAIAHRLRRFGLPAPLRQRFPARRPA